MKYENEILYFIFHIIVQIYIMWKREDRVDYSYKDDGVGVLLVQETIRDVRVRQGVSETVKISVLDT